MEPPRRSVAPQPVADRARAAATHGIAIMQRVGATHRWNTCALQSQWGRRGPCACSIRDTDFAADAASAAFDASAASRAGLRKQTVQGDGRPDRLLQAQTTRRACVARAPRDDTPTQAEPGGLAVAHLLVVVHKILRLALRMPRAAGPRADVRARRARAASGRAHAVTRTCALPPAPARATRAPLRAASAPVRASARDACVGAQTADT